MTECPQKARATDDPGGWTLPKIARQGSEGSSSPAPTNRWFENVSPEAAAPSESGRSTAGSASRRWETTTEISIEAAPAAAACGAMGCRESEDLLRVEKGEEVRVLCQDHARWWIR